MSWSRLRRPAPALPSPLLTTAICTRARNGQSADQQATLTDMSVIASVADISTYSPME